MEVKLGDEIAPAHGDPEGHVHARKFTVVGILDTQRHAERPGRLRQHGRLLPDGGPRQAARGDPASEDDAAKSEPQTREEYDKLLAAEAAKRKKELELLRAADPEPLPVEQREVTAILIKTPPMVAPALENGINEGREAQAVLPIAVIVGLFEFIVDPIHWTLLVLTGMICIVSGISILVSIYNSMSERRQEIAVMRALGAGRGTVMSIILLESTLLALGGGLVGWFAGHALGALASPWIEEATGVRVGFFTFEPSVDLRRAPGPDAQRARAAGAGAHSCPRRSGHPGRPLAGNHRLSDRRGQVAGEVGASDEREA